MSMTIPAAVSDTTGTDPLFSPLKLRSGLELPNRVAKAAMEESLAVRGQLPGRHLECLYRHWAHSGAGMLITGNVMVDHRALTAPGTIALEANTPLDPFWRWAIVAKMGGARAIMQINHPGVAVPANLNGLTWAPSEVAIDLGKLSGLFRAPTAMTDQDIRETISRFAVTARRAAEAGFDGVQIHAAHGYLLSQFLSPLTNQRTDEWGGSLEGRARLLTSIVAAVQTAVPAGFAVLVKLNSSDFQKGGFTAAEAAQVVGLLGSLNVDLVELSGGTMESPASLGQRTADKRLSTLAREAFFLEFAEEILATATMPIMLTGGIENREVAERVRARGVAVVGMATAMAITPDLPSRWATGPTDPVDLPTVTWGNPVLAAGAQLSLIHRQFRRLSKGGTARSGDSAVLTFVMDQARRQVAAVRYRRWRRAQARNAPGPAQ
ncbi:NADH:flavin oxidoreductase/NADH oxidase family protein [Streptomyces sp. NPDC127110]|uniref:NADH:flavin oxidoreductase/NADH oxidase family protein n=1 Tax=Streptomyces sp. NPDC127110 TaxID=3345362 RepID=UPI003631D5B5